MSAAALVEAEGIDDFWFGNDHRGELGLVALTEDDPQAAIDVLTPAWERTVERGLGEFSIRSAVSRRRP